MSTCDPRAEAAAPLLLELARAARARRFYSASHPTVHDALRRSAAGFRDALARLGTLRLDVIPGGFTLDDGTPVAGLGLDELSDLLRARGVTCLDARPGLELRELAVTVDLLASDDEVPLADLLNAHDVWNLRCGDADQRGRSTGPRLQQPGEADGEDRTPRTPPGRATLDLLGLLGELDRCEQPRGYQMVARRMEPALAQLLDEKNYVDAYRAVLVFARHVAGRGPSRRAVREEAHGQLRALLVHEEFLRYVVDQARSDASLTSVQAVQVLDSVGAPAVSLLLEEHAAAGSREQASLVSILIALGESAFPTVVDELASGNSRRVRRAAMLLGDLQNPGGVEFLAELVQVGDRQVSREAARSLLKIGTERAMLSLVAALEADERVAITAAECLGRSRSRTALRGLIRAVGAGAAQPDAVRVAAIHALGRIGHPGAVGCLRNVIRRRGLLGRARRRPLRVAAAQSLGRIGNDAAVAELRVQSKRGDPAVREACRTALASSEE